MGLTVQVGMYADLLENDPEGAEWLEATFKEVNEVLKEDGIDVHTEPTSIDNLNSRAACDSFPYSFIHYLRRFYANLVAQSDWQPVLVPEGEDPAEDPVVEDESMMFESHLLCHSDCEGFYFPVKFDDILVDDNNRIPGGLLGSSYKLMDELIYIAPKLGIELSDGMLSDDEADRINGLAESDEGFYRELCVWIALYEAARLSIEHKTAISFC